MFIVLFLSIVCSEGSVALSAGSCVYYIIKHSLELKASDAEMVCSVELLST